MAKYVKPVVLAGMLVLLAVFLRHTDFQSVGASLSLVGYRFSALLLTTFAAYFLGTISWKYCLGDKSGEISATRLFFVRHIGETAALLNPAGMVGGEAVKVLLLKDHGIAAKSATASIVMARVIMVITQLLVAGIALAFFLAKEPGITIPPGKLLLYSPVVPLVLAAGWFGLRYLAGKSPEFMQLFKNSRKKLLYACFFAALHWVVGGLEFYFILRFLGHPVTMTDALAADMGVVFFKVAGTFIPGQLGIEEYGNKVMLSAIGLPGAGLWVTASILRRARQLTWIVFGVVLYFVLYNGRKIPQQEV
ncbi:lysylphosphatidylglycerol synthase transmembrane domain-containing protein [Hufsiella ginkgonis]|uniref:Flippase-like domain-containing protein n=1 Tax=Hufsiella ginkgonis TaxID=2695274 RepID=A0A7K1XZB4_9SPHI|nr:lysylphosphatidylglycerol synthase transmembrane domain-containing protein [Hufsiella ginkgonis]MXV16351.1 hypothetical protein [Hufsiella ginkgonis]